METADDCGWRLADFPRVATEFMNEFMKEICKWDRKRGS